MGEVTGITEIKTSGRYTYEMGVATRSNDPNDQALGRTGMLTVELASTDALEDETEKTWLVSSCG